QYSPSVQPAPVMINPTQQPQQAPPPQQPPIRIRDPNQGGRDITEEIMSGGRSATTPTPPQVIPYCVLTSLKLRSRSLCHWSKTDSFHKYYCKLRFSEKYKQFSAIFYRPKGPCMLGMTWRNQSGEFVEFSLGKVDETESPASAETPPPPAPLNAELVEAKQETDSQMTPSAELADQSVAPTAATEVPPLLIKDQQSPSPLPSAVASTTPAEVVNKDNTKVCDTVDAPVSPSAPLGAQDAPVKKEEPQATPVPAEKVPEKEEKETEDVKKIEEEQVTSSKLEMPAEVVATETPVNVAQEDMATKTETETEPAVSAQEPAAPQTQNGVPSSVLEPEPTLVETVASPLSNGLPQHIEEMSEEVAFSDTTPLDKPEASQSQESTTVAKTETPAREEEEEEEEEEGKEEEEEEEEEEKKKKEEEEEEKEEKEEEEENEKSEDAPPASIKNWKPINPEEKKRYDREFLLGFQFISASMNKPEGLPTISDVVLDKVNKTPLRPADPARLMSVGPDFTPSYLGNLGSRSVGGPRGPPPGPRRSQQGQRKEPRKIISSMSLNDDVQLNKAEKAWKPSMKKPTQAGDQEQAKTLELFKRLRSILNKLTPQKFQELMKQVTELTIDTEERLKGAIDLIFEKAISEPNFSVAYANMCRCLMGLKVPTSDKPGLFVNFRKLLLNRCQKEFEKDQDDDEIFEKKQKEMEASKDDEERERLRVELEEARDKARRRSLGNIKFIGELFKLKMLTEAIMHDCVVKLLKNHDEESLECLCRLLSTIGKDLDFEKAKPRMDQYFNQMDKIIKERKTSSRIRFMLQDVLDLRRSNWVPRRGDQGPKTIDQIHKEAEMEEHREQIKVQQQLMSKKESGGGRMGGWNTVPISKNRPIDTTRLSKITKVRVFNQKKKSLRNLGKGTWGSWGKGSSGGTGAKPASGEQGKTFFKKAAQFRMRDFFNLVGFFAAKRDSAPTPPPLPKAALSEEEVEKKANAIIEEYLHINDMKEALQCVAELNSTALLYVFVRTGVESTLERSTIAREHMGQLLHELVKAGTLPTQQYYKGLQEILEVADDMAIDIPHIWLYLAELITPMLLEGGIAMGQLFREISKPLVPLEKAAVLLVQILNLLCKEMTQKKVGAMWTEGALKWSDFLPKDEDVNKFVTEQKVDFTTGSGEEIESKEVGKKKALSGEELSKQLDRLLQDKATNQRIIDWVEANLDEQQVASNQLIRALMTSVCQSAIICDNPYRLDAQQIKERAKLLHKYLCDEQKELQALYALQALMVHMEQPANLLRMFFDALYDEDVIKDEAFYKWESSKDPAEQTGKGVALKSVTAFFTWLREPEEESDKE
uniref:Eukaryotic translation initiation factor 4 gamma 1-like n=1 Tax=Echeneis naucrates TaxID=173247 RepID=A0A665V903_ECHNA